MHAWTRIAGVVAAFRCCGSVPASPQSSRPDRHRGPRSLDCYERMPTDTVNLALRDASTQSTLRLLAQNYKVNMVVTDDVTGTVTLDFLSRAGARRVPGHPRFQWARLRQAGRAPPGEHGGPAGSG